MVFKESIYKFLTQIRDKPYFKKPDLLGGPPQKCNQRWKYSYHEEKGHRTENCRALKIFLDQLVQDGHLKDFIDQEKTRAKDVEAKPNPKFDWSHEEADDT